MTCNICKMDYNVCEKCGCSVLQGSSSAQHRQFCSGKVNETMPPWVAPPGECPSCNQKKVEDPFKKEVSRIKILELNERIEFGDEGKHVQCRNCNYVDVLYAFTYEHVDRHRHFQYCPKCDSKACFYIND